MSGDLVPFVLKCVTGRGASPIATTFPEVQAQWACESKPSADNIIVSGHRFAEILVFLKQAFGEPDRCLDSQPNAAAGDFERHQAIYGVNRIGVGLILAGDSKDTLICIIGTRKT
jgi:hypothetical protein